MTSKAVVLARVSTRSQEDEGYSLDAQLKLMRNYCEKNKLTIDKEFKIAETASKDQRRKVFHELVSYVSKHRINHLVVEKTDRLTRNFKDATTIDGWLENDERRMLHLVKENLILHKHARSDAKFMWNIYLSVAKKYSDNLREEAMKGWAEKLAQGWLPAEPPPGYMTITQVGKKIHVVNPATYKFMPGIFQLALLSGYSRVKLSEEMALVGITTKSGRPFSPSAVTRILTNPFYIGINRLQGREYPGAQEAIISKKVFNDVQRKLKRRGHEQGMRKHNPVFKRMIDCANCGSLISWSKQKGRFYGACQRRKSGCWGTKYLREDRVELLVVRELEAINDPNGRVLAKLKDSLLIIQPQDVGMFRQKMIDEMTRLISKLRRMEERLYDDRLSGFISKEKYEQKRRQIAVQALDATERLALLRETQDAPRPLPQEPESDNPIADLYLKCAPHQKRIILSGLFKRIAAAGEAVRFEWRS